VNATTTRGGLLGLHAQTSLHPGSGTALGTVDLPVQRERHTHWPTIAGSALKGILRDACREQIARRPDLDTLHRFDDERDDQGQVTKLAARKGRHRERADATLELNLLFGPPTAGSSEFAGALSVTDARLLAFPVRSLKGVFAWVSCPAVLDRLKRDAALAGMTLHWPDVKPDLDHAVIASGSPCLVGDKVVLEEFEFSKTDGDPAVAAGWIAEKLLPDRPAFAGTVARFRHHFVILGDDDFTHFARHATEVQARVGLNYETKTVREGALFYQEFLPAETLFYAVVLANTARARFDAKPAAAVLDTLTGHLPAVLQIGGDETTGKGYCATRFFAAGGGSQGGQS
jgi:CRISPR-associated protein Cmr4